MGSALRNYAVPDNVVAKSLYDANSLLIAVSDNDPAAVAIAASRFVGRKATGDPGVMTPAEALALLSGTVAQVQHAVVSSVVSGSTQLPLDDTVPQNTEGVEAITCAITPKSASNILLIIANIGFSYSSGSGATGGIALFQDSTAGALAAMIVSGRVDLGYATPSTLIYKMTAGTTSSTTFKVRFGSGVAGTSYINSQLSSANRAFGGVASTTLTIIEFVA